MPRTETIERTLYTFDELTDKAKETAREWMRRSVSENFSDDAENMFDDFERAANILGIEFSTHSVKLMNGTFAKAPNIFFSGFSSQGDGASFSGSYRYAKGARKAIKAEYPKDDTLATIAKGLQDIQRKNFYRLTASITQSGRYYHSHTMIIFTERTDLVEVSNSTDSTLRELLRDFADWMYRQLEKEYDYQMSDEAVDELLKDNGYEFTANGKLA